MSHESDEAVKSAEYHLKRAHELWKDLDPQNPPPVHISSIDWHFASAQVQSRLGLTHAVNELTEMMNQHEFDVNVEVDTTRLERAIERRT